MDQTSQKIIDAAMELMMERGYSATTTKDIARRAAVNECTIFRKFSEKKEIVLQAMEQEKWHPDLCLEDLQGWTGDLEDDLARFSRSYMAKVTPRFVKLSIGLRTPELADATSQGIMAVPQTFKEGVTDYLREMNRAGIIKRDDFEILSMMFLSLNFGFIFLKASFDSKLTPLDEESYIQGMIHSFVNGIR